jgi:hypothetical protein
LVFQRAVHHICVCAYVYVYVYMYDQALTAEGNMCHLTYQWCGLYDFQFLTCQEYQDVTTCHRILKVTAFFSPFKYKRGIQWGAFISGIKIFNRLQPLILKLKSEIPRLRVALRKYLITHVFFFLLMSFLSSIQASQHH